MVRKSSTQQSLHHLLIHSNMQHKDLLQAAPAPCSSKLMPLQHTMRIITSSADHLVPHSCAECQPVPAELTHPEAEGSLAVSPSRNSPPSTNIILRLHTDGQHHQQQSLLPQIAGPLHLQVHRLGTGKGQPNSQAANHPIEQPINTFKRLPTEVQRNMHAPCTHSESLYSNTSGERYKQSTPAYDLPALNSKPHSAASSTIDIKGKLAGCRSDEDSRNQPADHPSSSATASRISAEIKMTASTELCMTGWQRFCSPPSTPAAGQAPAKMSAVHRPIVMISNPDHQIDSHHSPSSPADHEVCLELNIGPSSRGSWSPAAGSRKSLQDIHSEERGGFSKWQRPEPKEKHVLQPAPYPCNPGRLLSSECSQKLDNVSPLRFSLASNNESAIATYTSTLCGSKHPVASMNSNCENMDKSAKSTCNTTAVSGPFDPPSPPRFLGMWMTDLPLHQCSSEEAGIHADDHELVPTNMLLQAAFPSEIPTKRRKLANSYHGTRHPELVKDKEEKIFPQQLIGKLDVDRLRYQLTLSIPCTTIRCVDMPNVQEKSLVDFLHAKKQHKEHFLDNIVVQEDVYQSHPWHFTSATGEGVSQGGGTAGGSSLYFCCSTKYTKRGNMTRNRMTREGGRWKQQGMVQPIFYGRGQAEAAHKTYLSYIPRGSATTASSATIGDVTSTGGSCSRASFFVNYFNHPADGSNHLAGTNVDRSSISSTASAAHSNSGRLKHRHRMIEIALQEDLLLEKRSFQLKVAPKPFLVVCILRNTT